MNAPRILTVDIETSPLLSWHWGLHKQEIGIEQIVQDTRVICWAAKWHGERGIQFKSEFHDKPKDMLKTVHGLLTEADAVAHWNGNTFDIPHLNREFKQAGLSRVPPVIQLDLMRITQKYFRFPSYKLDYVSRRLGVGGKTHHTGWRLWLECLDGNEKAWALMSRYNINDVRITDGVLAELLPFVTTLNRNLFDETEGRCPNPGCGSTHIQRRGYRPTKVGLYPRYQCQECGNWFQGGRAEFRVDARSI